MVDWLIAGLGNPGREYALTRHNAGFRAVAALARRHQVDFSRRQARAEIADLELAGRRVLLVRPQTFMNLSGESVGELVRWYRLVPQQVLVVFDDMDLPLGTIRLRASGSAGGQNGMKSVIQHLGTDQVPRLRIGVDRAPASLEGRGGVPGSRGGTAREREATISHVLRRFSPPEEARFTAEVLPRACDAMEAVVRDGLVAAMNRFNAPPTPGEPAPAS